MQSWEILKIENKLIKKVQNNSSEQKWRETTYLCVEVISSNKRQFTGYKFTFDVIVTLIFSSIAVRIRKEYFLTEADFYLFF